MYIQSIVKAHRTLKVQISLDSFSALVGLRFRRIWEIFEKFCHYIKIKTGIYSYLLLNILFSCVPAAFEFIIPAYTTQLSLSISIFKSNRYFTQFGAEKQLLISCFDSSVCAQLMTKETSDAIYRYIYRVQPSTHKVSFNNGAKSIFKLKLI